MSTGYFNFELYTVLAETLKRTVTRWQSEMCALSFHSQDLISSSVLTVFYRILGMLVGEFGSGSTNNPLMIILITQG